MESTMEIPASDNVDNIEYPYYIDCKVVSIELSQSCNYLYQSTRSYKCNGTTVYVASTECTVDKDKGLLYNDQLIQCITCTCTSVNSCTECTQCTETIVCKNNMSTISSYIHEIGTTDNYVCGCKFLGYTKLTEDNLSIDESSLSVYDNQYYVYDKTSKKYLCTICGEFPEDGSSYTLCRIVDYNKLYEYTWGFNSEGCPAWNCTFKTLYVYDPFDGGKYICDYTGVGGPMPAIYTDKPKPDGMNYFNGDEWQSTQVDISPYHAIYVAGTKKGLNTDDAFTGSLLCIVCKDKWAKDTYDSINGFACTSQPLPSKSVSIAEFCRYELSGTVKDGGSTFVLATWSVVCKEKDENDTGTLSQS